MIDVSWGGNPTRPAVNRPVGPTVHSIIVEVAFKYGLTLPQLVGRQRARKFAWPRQEVMWRASRDTKASLVQIATALGMSDHTSVWYGIRAHEARTQRAEDAKSCSPISS